MLALLACVAPESPAGRTTYEDLLETGGAFEETGGDADPDTATDGSGTGGGVSDEDTGSPAATPYNLLLLTFDAAAERSVIANVPRLLATLEGLGGVSYTRHYAQGDYTAPSMTALLTGQPPWSALGENLYGSGGEPLPIPEDTPTLAGMLRGAGWSTTLLTGGGMVGATTGTDAGYDVYLDFHEAPVAQAAAAVEELGDWDGGEPRFLHVHNMSLGHDPYVTFANSCAASAAGSTCPLVPDWSAVDALDTLTRHGMDMSDSEVAACRADAERKQACELAFADELFAPLLNLVDPARTVIVFTVDHGESWGTATGGWGHAFGLWEEQVAVPLYVHVPGDAGLAYHPAPTSHGDLLPTLLDAVGVPNALPGAARLTSPGRTPVSAHRGKSPGQFLLGATDGGLRYQRDISGGQEGLFLVDDEGLDNLLGLQPVPESLRAEVDRAVKSALASGAEAW